MDKESCCTPVGKKKHSSCNDDLCSVCLSPFRGPEGISPSTPSKGPMVETKCKHLFHQSCLQNARRWKSECPMCRSALSPIIQQIQWAQDNLVPTRQEIIQAASRARNAVRLAMSRRNTTSSVPIVVGGTL